mmetsp:Transcript_45975/g.130034  ORF Transcript_45975/g.130034 Transcript_45975/m.130034 type:complete len:203 (+) Transcript_45975:423-1031(+)
MTKGMAGRSCRGICAAVSSSLKSRRATWTCGISWRTVRAMPQMVTAATFVKLEGMCCPVIREFTPQVWITMGVFATSPLAMQPTRSPNSMQFCVGTLSLRQWPQTMMCEGARSAASTVGSGPTIFGTPQYFLPAAATSSTSLGTVLSVVVDFSGPVEGAAPPPPARPTGRLGVVFRTSAVAARACSMVCFSTSAFAASPSRR